MGTGDDLPNLSDLFARITPRDYMPSYSAASNKFVTHKGWTVDPYYAPVVTGEPIAKPLLVEPKVELLDIWL
jgi:hypothetical protein